MTNDSFKNFDTMDEALECLLRMNMETLTNLAMLHNAEPDLVMLMCQAFSSMLMKFSVEQRKEMLDMCVKDILEGAEFYAKEKNKKDHH